MLRERIETLTQELEVVDWHINFSLDGLTPKEVLRFISIALYLLQKLKMYQQMMDLHESFVVNKHIMSRCNPFSLHYIIQYNQLQPQLRNVIRY